MERRKTTIGMAVDACIAEATEEWFREHAGMRTREEAASNDVKKIIAVTERFPGGRLQVSITVVAKTIRATHNAFFRYQLSDSLGYVREEPSKARR